MTIDIDQFTQVLSSSAARYASQILQVAEEKGVSPFIIAAIGDRESGWGKYLDSNMCGDSGHGRGFLQIDDRSHGAWLAANDWKDAYTNISEGMVILNQNIAFLSSKAVVPGLTDGTNVTVHSGAAQVRASSPGTYTDPRPIAGDDLLAAAIAAYNTGEGNVLMSLAVGVDVDTTTTGANYSSAVIADANAMLAKFNTLGPAYTG